MVVVQTLNACFISDEKRWGVEWLRGPGFDTGGLSARGPKWLFERWFETGDSGLRTWGGVEGVPLTSTKVLREIQRLQVHVKVWRTDRINFLNFLISLELRG